MMHGIANFKFFNVFVSSIYFVAQMPPTRTLVASSLKFLYHRHTLALLWPG